jgi:hypothetical protein
VKRPISVPRAPRIEVLKRKVKAKVPCIIGPNFGGCGGGGSGGSAPTVTAISPNTGPTTGGTSVSITVTDSTGCTAAHVNGVAITSFAIGDATHVTGVTGSGMSAGAGDVTVTNGFGTGTDAGAFTASAAPVAPTAINKSLGDASGGTVVIITHPNTTGLTGAKVCGVALTSFSIVDSTHVQGTTAAMTASATPGDVKVTNASGDSPALAGVFEAFWPTNISGCCLWLRADLGITTSAGKTTVWADQSGHGFDFASATGAINHPPDAPATWTNGKPAITWHAGDFSSQGDRLDNIAPPAALTGASAAEGFVIGQATSTGVSIGEGLWNFGTGSAGWFPYADGNDYENFCNSGRPAGTGGGTYTVPWMYNIQSSAAAMFGTLNGTTIMNFSGGGLGFAVPTNCYIGNSLAGFDGQTAEYVVYNKILSSGERTRVTAYKADRYGF